VPAPIGSHAGFSEEHTSPASCHRGTGHDRRYGATAAAAAAAFRVTIPFGRLVDGNRSSFRAVHAPAGIYFKEEMVRTISGAGRKSFLRSTHWL
jgi:hypothetical protein